MFTTWSSFKTKVQDRKYSNRKINGRRKKRPKKRKRHKEEDDEDKVEPTRLQDPLKGDHIVAKILRKIKTRSTITGPATDVLAMDCEFGGYGASGMSNCLIRISIVNYVGDIVLDAVVRPAQYVTDFRTDITGVRAGDLRNAVDFKIIQFNACELLKKAPILVGHALNNDLRVLGIKHRPDLMRDTSKFRVYCPQRPKKLKYLAKKHLGIDIQKGSHSSVEDARAALALYRLHEAEWEETHTIQTNNSKAFKKRKIKKKRMRTN